MADKRDSSLVFFSKATSNQWSYVLSLYSEVLKVRAQQTRGTKKGGPQELIKLDNWYHEQLPKLINSRKDRFVSHEELIQITKWKLWRGKNRARILDLVRINTETAVMQTSKKAFRKLPNLNGAISALTTLKGVGPATASAVLAAGAPDQCPYMADESMLATPGIEATDYTVAEYLNFSEQIKSCCDKLKEQDPDFKWNPHKVELCLWTHYWIKQMDLNLLDEMPLSDGTVPKAMKSDPDNGKNSNNEGEVNSTNTNTNTSNNSNSNNNNNNNSNSSSSSSGSSGNNNNIGDENETDKSNDTLINPSEVSSHSFASATNNNITTSLNTVDDTSDINATTTCSTTCSTTITTNINSNVTTTITTNTTNVNINNNTSNSNLTCNEDSLSSTAATNGSIVKIMDEDSNVSASVSNVSEGDEKSNDSLNCENKSNSSNSNQFRRPDESQNLLNTNPLTVIEDSKDGLGLSSEENSNQNMLSNEEYSDLSYSNLSCDDNNSNSTAEHSNDKTEVSTVCSQGSSEPQLKKQRVE